MKRKNEFWMTVLRVALFVVVFVSFYCVLKPGPYRTVGLWVFIPSMTAFIVLFISRQIAFFRKEFRFEFEKIKQDHNKMIIKVSGRLGGTTNKEWREAVLHILTCDSELCSEAASQLWETLESALKGKARFG